MINRLEDVQLIKDINFLDSDYFTRDISLNLKREMAKNCKQRFNLLINRNLNNWNALPDEIVIAKLITVKTHLEGILLFMLVIRL